MCVTKPMMAKNATNAHVSNLYRSTRLYFCVSDITTVWVLCTSCRPLQWWSVCPNIVAIIGHPLLGVVVHLLCDC